MGILSLIIQHGLFLHLDGLNPRFLGPLQGFVSTRSVPTIRCRTAMRAEGEAELESSVPS